MAWEFFAQSVFEVVLSASVCERKNMGEEKENARIVTDIDEWRKKEEE